MESGCAAGASESIAEPSAAAAAAIGGAHSDDAASNGVTGVWEGMSQGPRAAMRYITLTMVQQGNDVTGYYRCAYGTQLCRNMEETGVIKDGKMIGKRLMMRVMLGDAPTCYFTGLPPAHKPHRVYTFTHSHARRV